MTDTYSKKQCPQGICNGDGFIYKENPDTKQLVAHACACRDEREQRMTQDRLLKAADIPLKYRNATLEKFKEDIECLNQSKNRLIFPIIDNIIVNTDIFMEGEKAALWIWGSPTCGKTSLAVSIGKILISKKFKVRFIDMQHLLDMFINFDPEGSKNTYFNELKQYDAYILNDAFNTTKAHTKGEYTRIQLYNWMNDILANRKRLICTSNVLISSIDREYAACKDLLLVDGLPLEITGSFDTILTRESEKNGFKL